MRFDQTRIPGPEVATFVDIEELPILQHLREHRGEPALHHPRQPFPRVLPLDVPPDLVPGETAPVGLRR